MCVCVCVCVHVYVRVQLKQEKLHDLEFHAVDHYVS